MILINNNFLLLKKRSFIKNKLLNYLKLNITNKTNFFSSFIWIEFQLTLILIIKGHNNKPFIADYNAQIGYNYQIQQYLSNNLQQTATGSYDANSMYQQGINNDLVQPYSVANFDFSNDTSHFVQQKVSASEEEERQEYSTIKPCPNNEETAKREPDEVARTNETKGSFSAEYLMRPPDSESIAAAALTAKKNRNKRRTRIKFEQEQVRITRFLSLNSLQ